METCRIYLSGGMKGTSWEEQTKWRRQFADAIKWNYEFDKNASVFDPTQYYNYEETLQKSEKEIMEFELNALRNSDLVVVNFNEPSSIGTSMELMLAYELRIPIVALNKDKKEIHPWLLETCSRVCDNMRELVEYVVDFYLK